MQYANKNVDQPVHSRSLISVFVTDRCLVSYFNLKLQDSCWKGDFGTQANSADPDQTPQNWSLLTWRSNKNKMKKEHQTPLKWQMDFQLIRTDRSTGQIWVNCNGEILLIYKVQIGTLKSIKTWYGHARNLKHAVKRSHGEKKKRVKIAYLLA